MSGDVQPRKRKDKKKKKDDYTGLAPPAEEKPTHVHTPASSHSSSEGGVVIMHAQHDHGTGGHWCAKLVFFILLGILVGLIGLIILENRGLTDLDTPNSESRYAAVFDGWVDEGSPDDHHHDKHTFELTHPDDSDDHDNADEAHKVSEELGSEEQQDDGSDEKDEDSNDEADDNSEEQDNEDSEEDADEDSEREEDDNSEEDSNDVSEEDKDDGVSDEQLEDNSADQADEQSQEQGDQNSDEQDDEEDNASMEDDNEASNEQDDTGSNEQDNEDSNEEDNEDSNERNDDSAEQNEDNSAEQNDDDSAEQNDGDSAEENDGDSEERNLQEESKETNEDNDDSDQDNEEQDGGDLSDQENDVELEDIVKETDTQAASEGSKEKDVSDDEGGNESEIDDIQDDFSDIEEQISDYAKEDFQEEFLEDEVEQEGGESVHREDKPYEELDSAEEVVVDNAAGEQEYEERKAKEQQAAEEETSNLGVKFGVGVALVAVAHAVLVRKWRNAREQAATGERPERRLTLMEDSLLLGTDGKLSPTSGKKVFFSPTTTEHEANSEESDLEEEEEQEEQYNYEPPVKSASSFFTKPQPQIVHRAPVEDEDDDIMQVEEFSKKIGFAETQSPPFTGQPKNLPLVKNEEIEVSEDEISEDEMPGDVEVISDDDVNEKNKAEKQEKEEPVAEEEEEAAEEDEDVVEEEEDEVEEVDDEEDISDVDDVELMKRLEMKYGKLPDEEIAQEPSRKRKPEGGLSVEAWADEPTDSQWRHQLDLAQAELDEGKVDEARDKYLRVLRVAPKSTRALWGYARSLDVMAERKKSNEILNAAIAAYNNLLNLGPALSDKLFKDVANRTINRIRFKGNALLAEPVHKLLIERFDAEPKHRNDLAICYLMTNNPHKARIVLKETLQRWPKDGVALVHHGFILKTVDGKLEEAVTYLQRGIDTGDEGTLDGRFFFQLGDALLMLGRKKEADEVHKMGSLKGIFLSPEQRSLYNVDRLLGRPWWNVDQTPYSNLVNDLERHWREILKEAVSMADEYGAEKEGLKSKGQWTQLELFTRGREIPGRCKKAPVTCTIVRKEAAAKNCRRGQIKFSALTPGTHIRPHVGPTNCRLRSHLGLTNTEGAYLRVHNETRKWHEGKVFIFDDSFEHEVWHNGTGTRIVLIVDLWHPGLTALERSALPAI